MRFRIQLNSVRCDPMVLHARSWAGQVLTGQTRSSQFASWGSYSIGGVASNESIICGHHQRRGSGWSGGGAMFLNRNVTYESNPVYYSKTSGTNQIQGTIRMGGNLSASYPMGLFPTPSDSQLDSDGTTAIARTEPTNPAFDLSVFLGELRAEGLPKMPDLVTREKVLTAKNAGDNYLSVEFGWLPLVRGIRDFAHTVANSDDIVRKYQEGANQVIQRSYEWPLLDESYAEPMSFGSLHQNGGSWTRGGRHQRRFQRKWFEVEYQYYLPTGGSTNDKFRRYGSYARKLYGLDLSPEVLWNLSPWSWAADWFGNVGDVMHNVSAIGTDGLVLKNGYMMCHTGKITTDHGYHAGTGAVGSRTNVVETKQRRPATPYGFGLSYDGLSIKQKAILAALGASRW